jgi:hypothetical protein
MSWLRHLQAIDRFFEEKLALVEVIRRIKDIHTPGLHLLLAGQVLLKIVCLLMRWLFSLAVLVVRGDGEKNAERQAAHRYLPAPSARSEPNRRCA